jgi:hypothetical protein
VHPTASRACAAPFAFWRPARLSRRRYCGHVAQAPDLQSNGREGAAAKPNPSGQLNRFDPVLSFDPSGERIKARTNSIDQTQHGTSAAKIKARKAGFYQLEIYVISACSHRITDAYSYK